MCDKSFILEKKTYHNIELVLKADLQHISGILLFFFLWLYIPEHPRKQFFRQVKMEPPPLGGVNNVSCSRTQPGFSGV